MAAAVSVPVERPRVWCRRPLAPTADVAAVRSTTVGIAMTTKTLRIVGTRQDARLQALAPLVRTADREQRTALATLVTDSFALQVLATTAAEGEEPEPGGSDSPPPIEVPDLFGEAPRWEDVHGNRYDNWFDYIQAATNGEFGRISGLTEEDFFPW